MFFFIIFVYEFLCFCLKSSGVKVDNSVLEKFHEFKIKKNIGYLVLGFSDDISKIVVLNEGANKVSPNASVEEKSKILSTCCFCCSYKITIYSRSKMGWNARYITRQWCTIHCHRYFLRYKRRFTNRNLFYFLVKTNWNLSNFIYLLCFCFVIFSRAPDTATIKRKMLCASSKDALKNALQGIRNHVQATCKADLDLEAIISEKIKSK